jgi:energy-coupling factor transporter ATP-binding protein EcfA2
VNWRLNEGNGAAVYQLGVQDDGVPIGISEEDLDESINNLRYMADVIGCTMSVKNKFHGRDDGMYTAEVVLQRKERDSVDVVLLPIAVAGHEACGKSTLIGVLSSGVVDNAKGLARTMVLRHNHELQSGQTSCIVDHNLYYSADGKILNQGPDSRVRSRSELELADLTCRIVSFIDLAGHSKYLKTTLDGWVQRSPDDCLLCVAANQSGGLQSMTIEHLGISCALELRICVALTKCDLVSDVELESMVDLLRDVFETHCGKRVVVIRNQEQVVEVLLSYLHSSEGRHDDIVPIFLTSSVTGRGLDQLQSFLFQLPRSGSLFYNSRRGARDTSGTTSSLESAVDDQEVQTTATDSASSRESATMGNQTTKTPPAVEVRILGYYQQSQVSTSATNVDDTVLATVSEEEDSDPSSWTLCDGLIGPQVVLLGLVRVGVLAIGSTLVGEDQSVPTRRLIFLIRLYPKTFYVVVTCRHILSWPRQSRNFSQLLCRVYSCE